MRCAKHVYLANDPNAPPELRDNPPPGFLKPTGEQLKMMGVDQDMLTPSYSNFRAAIYLKDPVVWGGDLQPRSVLALRGSTSAEEDWENNFNQDANKESSYYKAAVELGRLMAMLKVSIHIVGHSLGGGLSSAAQGASGLTASTYNAAGLHPRTIERYSHDTQYMAADPEKITAIRVKGEVLTKTQEEFIGSKGLSMFANKQVGTKRDVAPYHDEESFQNLKSIGYISSTEDFGSYLHGMDEVIAATEKSKTSDETALKNCRDNSRQ